MRKAFIYFCIFLNTSPGANLFAAPAGESAKESVVLEALVDKSLITIGEKIRYTLKLTAPADARVSFPASIVDFGGFAVKDFEQTMPKKIGQTHLEYRNTYVLDTFTVGSYIIPKQSIQVAFAGRDTQILKSPEIFVTVRSLLEEGELKDIRDIKKPLEVPASFLWMLIVAAIAAGALLIFLITKMRKYRPKRKPVVQIPPYQAALRALDEVEALGLIEKGQYKEYYYRLSNILREYLENQYQFRAPEQTTEEFFESMQHQSILDEIVLGKLREYLERCDLVKYAKLKPAEEEVRNLLQRTRDFIVETSSRESAKNSADKIVKKAG